jgi:hypothetical protein
MNLLNSLGKALLILGLVLALIGSIFLIWPKIPWLGKLPGDIFFKGERVSIYFPITTCLVISILLTLLFSLFRR